MKKNLTAYLAIFASLVFAFSCAKEEGGQEVPITPDTITVSLSLDENDDDNNKSEFTDSRGLQWTNTDVLRWISADGTKTATSTNISITNKGYNATFTIEIPGLSGANQTGHFTVNSEDNGSFKFTKSGLSGTDMTIAQEEIGKMNSAYTFLHSGKDITITKGTTSLTDDQVKLAMAGSIIRAIPYTTTHNDEQVLSVSFRSLDNVAGTIAYSYTTSGSTSSGITADAATRYLVSLTAPFSLEGVTDKNSSHAIYIPVPTATIHGYRITVETDQAFYMFESDDNLVLTENKVRNVSLNLDNAAVAVAPKKAQFDLSACTVSTFPALQYVTIGYSPDGDYSTNRTITNAEKTTRKNKYDTASNLWDNDASTCVHTNFDINTPDGSWALRDGVLQNDNYIQISLDKTIDKKFDLFIKNTDSGHYLGNWGGTAQGVDVKVSEDGSTFYNVTSCPLHFTGTASFSSECTWYDLSASTIQNINHIRILATNGCSSAGSYYGQQGKTRAGDFGIAEIKIWSINSTEPSYKVPVESVSVEPAEKTLSPGGTVQLSAKVLPTDAYNKNVEWSSSNEAVATVNASGYVEAIAVGTATITATTVQGGKTATCVITVESGVISVTGVTVSPTSKILTAEGSVQLSATVEPSDATNKNVTWSTSNGSVATVSNTGLVTAVAGGTATITVTTEDGGKTATCAISVWSDVTLTENCISTNDPMQYVCGGTGTGTYGLNLNPDWFNNINSSQTTARTNKYGTKAKMWDNDDTTCYHTNLDWGQPGTSWGQRSYSIGDRWSQRYIQINLPADKRYVKVWFRNADSGATAEGLKLQYSTDKENYTDFATGLNTGFGQTNEITDISAGSNNISSIRILNTKGDADWTFIRSAFGIAELKIWTAD